MMDNRGLINNARREFYMKRKSEKRKKNHMGIGLKLVLLTLPIIIIAFSLTTYISLETSKNIVKELSLDTLSAELDLQKSSVDNYLNGIETIGSELSSFISASHQYVTKDILLKLMEQATRDNLDILGCGIWMEPYALMGTQCFGPYTYRDAEGEIQLTHEYETKEFNYLNQSFYTNVKEHGVYFTDPYHDDIIDVTKVTCAVPIYYEEIFIGCVTVDIAIDKIVNLLNTAGKDKVYQLTLLNANLDNITSSRDTQGTLFKLDEISQEGRDNLQGNAKGQILHHSHFVDASVILFNTIEGVNWKLMIVEQEKDLYGFVEQITLIMLLVASIASGIIILCLLAFALKLARRMRALKQFTESLAEFNYSIGNLKDKSNDEVGGLTSAINRMYQSNKEILLDLKSNSTTLNDVGRKLEDTMNQLEKMFQQTQESLEEINEGTMTASAATEELNASMEQVRESVNHLNSQVITSHKIANEIQNRAEINRVESNKSYEQTELLTEKYKKELQKSIDEAECINEIGKLANIISEIAENINLLSLNASIEAARVGEQGKGFAVVASEIGKLASSTASAVTEIQNTIDAVQNSFRKLTNHTTGMIQFISDVVIPDYKKTMDVAGQYTVDSKNIEVAIDDITEMTGKLLLIVDEVNRAIESITETSCNTSNNTGEVMDIIASANEAMNSVIKVIGEQTKVVASLEGTVGNYQLD